MTTHPFVAWRFALVLLCGLGLSCAEPHGRSDQDFQGSVCDVPERYGRDIFTSTGQFDTRFSPQVEWRSDYEAQGYDIADSSKKIKLTLMDSFDVNNNGNHDLVIDIKTYGSQLESGSIVSLNGLYMYWGGLDSGQIMPGATLDVSSRHNYSVISYGNIVGDGGDDLVLLSSEPQVYHEVDGELILDETISSETDFLHELGDGQPRYDVDGDGVLDIFRHKSSGEYAYEKRWVEFFFGPFSVSTDWQAPSLVLDSPQFGDSPSFEGCGGCDFYNEWIGIVPLGDGSLEAYTGVTYTYMNEDHQREESLIGYWLIPSPVMPGYQVPNDFGQLKEPRSGLEKALGDLSGDGLPDILWLRGDNKLELQSTLPRAGGWWEPRVDVEICAEHDGTGYMNVSVGDFNGDGINDLLIGAPSWSPEPVFNEQHKLVDDPRAPGVVYVVLGPITEAISLSQAAIRIEGAPGDHLGTVVAMGADINGDGMDDAVVGATGYSTLEGAGGESVDGYVGFLMGRNDL